MMKSHIWIFLVISISTFIAATSNETLSPVAENLPLSSTPSTTASALSSSTSSSDSESKSTAKSFMLMNKNSSSSNMSLPLMITTPQTTILYSQSTAAESTTSHYVNHHRRGEQKHLHSRNSLVLYDGSSKKRRSTENGSTLKPECEQFSIGDENSRTFTSPGYPALYTKNTDCVRVIEAKLGYQLRLDFRDKFMIEPSDDCKFDYLEIRDGAYGFSKMIGKYCGHNFPDSIDSSGRFLWLHFHSDENIEGEGFKAVYDYVPRPTSGVYDDTDCGEIIVYGKSEKYDGWLNISKINSDKLEYVKKHKLHVDCMWKIEVEVGWRIQLSFAEFKLIKPNDCEANFVDVFNDTTDLTSRQKNFCGSIADSATINSNVAHIRFFAEADAFADSIAVNILFTAFRQKGVKNKEEPCREDEYDCEDQTCIKKELKCNDEVNCRFRWDEAEENCKNEASENEKMYIILIVFGVMLSIMIIAFIFNCARKIMRDHKIIREHIRQSRESKLDEIERHSTKMTKSRENIALHQLTKIPPPSFDLDPVSPINNQFYQREEKERSTSNHDNVRKSESRNDVNMREQEIKHIFGSSYHDSDEYKDNSEMCDTACQTRESLFQPVFSRNKVTQSPLPSGMRFSTFGHLESSQSSPSPPLPPPSSIVTHCPTHSMKQLSMPHQHSHHHHYHHLHSSTNPSISDEIDNSMGTIGTINSKEKGKKYLMKKEEAMPSSRSAGESRKSAPDVIIIAGCNTSH